MTRSFSHITPRYVVDRLRWGRWQRRNPESPWLVPDSVWFLDGWLSSSDVMVEFGSGRSTRWFARRVSHVVSIEHHAEWHGIVTKQLRDAGVTNVDYRLVPQEPEPYVGAGTEGLAGRQADVVLVDGRMRDYCALWALHHLSPRGIIVIDNANRYIPTVHRSPASRREADGPKSERWVDFLKRVSGWRRVWFTNGVNDTLVLFSGTE